MRAEDVQRRARLDGAVDGQPTIAVARARSDLAQVCVSLQWPLSDWSSTRWCNLPCASGRLTIRARGLAFATVLTLVATPAMLVIGDRLARFGALLSARIAGLFRFRRNREIAPAE